MTQSRLNWLFLLLGLALPALVFSFGDTPPPAARTGAFGELDCTECHTGGLNGPNGRLTISGVPASYTPGSTIPIQVTITDTGGGRLRWGFELSARFSNGKQAGSFTAVGGNTSVNLETGVQYASHRTAERQSGTSFTYTVNWTAPADASGGDIFFDGVGNAANGDQQANSADRIYKLRVTSAAPSSAPPPAVAAGGVVNAASFVPAPNNQVSRGQLISIFGSNMSDRDAAYFADRVPLPTQLGTTKVRLPGLNLDLPLVFVSKSQINAQLPFEVGDTGTQGLVAVAGSSTSAQENITVAPTAPGIFTVNQNGVGDGAILHADFTLVDAAKPAKAGETVLIFCTGLGNTASPVATGAAGSGERVTAAVTVTIGDKAAGVDFAGLAPGFVGLYQINAVVPTVTGSAKIVITAGAATSRPEVTMPVQ